MRNRQTSLPSPTRGFTLVEMMIVVAILTVLVVVALGAYRRYLDNTLREHFGFDGTPIRIEFRGRNSEY